MRLINIFENFDSLQVKLVDSETIEGNSEDYEPDVTFSYYDVFEDDKKVGELKTNDYFGSINGWLYNKTLPNDISEYVKSGARVNVQYVLNAFLKSKTGQKWLSNIEKYKVLDRPTNDYRLKDQTYDWSVKRQNK